MKTEKEKLQAKTVDQLKRYAKKVGANVVDPKTGKAKTKEQLVNAIVMKQRLGGKTLGAPSPAVKKLLNNIEKDAKRKALAPGPRVSKSGKKYYEYRRNRSDVKGSLLGQKYSVDRQLVGEVIIFAENDSKMYDALMKNYLPNLQKKVLAGKYDPEQAIKLLEYYYTNYVRPYMKMPRNYGFDPKLNPEERKAFAKYFRDQLWNEYGLKALSKKPKGPAVKK